MTVAQLLESSAVRRWLEKSGYAQRPADERDAVLEDLAGFCAYTGRTPEELVASCLRTTENGTAISTKGRRLMQETIETYIGARGLAGHEAIVAGNRIRGFLVHNGVFIQGRPSIR